MKRETKITKTINAMKKDDLYSLILFTLYKLRDIPDYLTLSELSYVLSDDNIPRFLSYFGGMTLKVPTSKDMRLVTKALLLYNLVNIEGEDFNKCLIEVVDQEFSKDEIKEAYTKIIEVMATYEFGKAE